MDRSLTTPGMPGYGLPKQSLYNRIFNRGRRRFDPYDSDKEEFPEENTEKNLEDYAINDSLVSDEQDSNFFEFPVDQVNEPLNLPERQVSRLDPYGSNTHYKNLNDFLNEEEQSKNFAAKEDQQAKMLRDTRFKSREDFESALKQDNLSLKKPNPLLKLPNAKTTNQVLQEASKERISRQDVQPQPYKKNWNPQANTSANRAWGAQNIANRGAELSQEEARISGLGDAGRGVQAAESTLPQAAESTGGVSSFAGRALPIISLGLLASSLYSNARSNRDFERQKQLTEGNRI